jgi:hypothetical protein
MMEVEEGKAPNEHGRDHRATSEDDAVREGNPGTPGIGPAALTGAVPLLVKGSSR